MNQATEELRRRASLLRALHHGRHPLVLPNIWDAASARLVRQTGFPVVATSSVAIASSLGYEDNDSMPVGEAFGAVRRIARSIDIPVTADMEAGYRLEPADFVERLLAAGAVGCNLEDTDHHGPRELVDLDQQAARLGAIRQAAGAAGVGIVINARVDSFRGREEPTPDTFEEAVRRARSYLGAGADCIYPIGLSDERLIRDFVSTLEAPVNILLRPDGVSLERLSELGVARVSLAGALMRQVYARLEMALVDLRERHPG